jgi:hypothetical protein
MKHILVSTVAFLVLTAMVAGCSGGNKIGESCTKQGDTNECVNGAVCTKDTANILKCLKTCTTQSDCQATESCNGVDGSSLKACRIK